MNIEITEIIAILSVTAFCVLGGIALLQLVKDEHERNLLSRLFLAAFALRFLFTLVTYATGTINVLGGGDDIGWYGMWARSYQWRAFGPDPIQSIYDPANRLPNQGYAYFGTFFYYIVGVQSQIALALLNSFINSITVVLVFKVSREFFSEEASRFVAIATAVMPSYLIWSALTVKESWLIFFEITTLFAVWRMIRSTGVFDFILYSLLAVVLVVLTLSFRFYVSSYLITGTFITLASARSSKPFLSALIALGGILLFLTFLNQARIIHFDLTSITQARLQEINKFRINISDPTQTGTGSGVILDYDTTTPVGFLMMATVGGAYLLLAPFPWQLFSGRQIFTLPDVVFWWYLVFGYILPGIRHTWKHQQALLVSITAFAVPLFLFYALMFGNVGLAYRQRAQLLPFLLIFAAAGYQNRYKPDKVKAKRKQRLIRMLKIAVDIEKRHN